MTRRKPPHYARWCRKHCGMEEAERIDLAALAEACDVGIFSAPADSFDGAAMVIEGCAGIFVNENQTRQRYRFTLAHEFGHLFLPWHHKQLVRGYRMVDTWNDPETVDDEREREANEFAAELLSPAILVRPLLRGGALDITKVVFIADRFGLSWTAAAVRVAQLAPDPVAALLFRGEELAWRFQHRSFPYGIPQNGLRPPVGSATANVCTGQGDVREAVNGDGAGWFVDRQYGETPAVLESSIRLGGRNEVLTLLWAPSG